MMSNDEPSRVRNAEQDPRVARTTHALGRALIELIQERDYDEITVQQILDRAGVGRATFYAHYRNKDDALHSSYEGLFSLFASLLDRPSERARRRLFPVAEFAEHLMEQRELADALRRSGRLDEAYGMFTGHAAGIIERRLGEWPEVRAAVPRRLLARMLAGALVEMLRWRQEHPSAIVTADLDGAFHELARGVLRKSP